MRTDDHRIVSEEEWLAARKELLAREKEATRLSDRLAAQRRELPWVRVTKPYRFEGPNGSETLADLFRGRGQLMVYHFMFGPDWEAGCRGCSYLADHIDAANLHLPQRDVTLLCVSRAPYAKLDAFKRRMGWRFEWLSSLDSDFNQDFDVSFTPEQKAAGEVEYNFAKKPFDGDEAPGISVFARGEDGAVFHTYSAYARGLDRLVGAYTYLDLAPKGRDEDALPWTMAWVRHHDSYER